MRKKRPAEGNKEEEDLIAEICDFDWEEASFAQWKKVHEDLNILVFVTVSKIQLTREETVVIRYCRTTREYHGEVLHDLKKEKKEITLKLSDNVQVGTQITYSGEGDRSGTSCGDLQVIVVLKD